MKEDFIGAIRAQNKVKLSFHSKEDGVILERICAPMDYGPSRRTFDKTERYHLWDYDSDQRKHVLSLLPKQVVAMEVLDDRFDPAEFVTWDVKKSPWFVERDWGDYS